jgi:pimeloyl-ACP methyl ester carboxylesterase
VITVSPEAGVLHSARFNLAFSVNGRWAVCLRSDDEDLALEHWTLTAKMALCRTVPEAVVDRGTHLLPLDDGQILLLRSENGATSGRQVVTLLQPEDFHIIERRLGSICARNGYLLPGPARNSLALIVALDDPERSTIWQVSDSPPRIELIMRIPGSLSGGVWLNRGRSMLAVNQSCDSYRSSGIVVDLAQRRWRRIWSVSDASIDRISLASPRSNLLIFTTNSTGEERLGCGILGDSTVRFPEALHRPGYVRQALALDEPGQQLLIREVAGAVSRPLIYHLADDRLTSIAGPPGTIAAPASWVGDLIRFRFSAPHQPPTLATVRLETTHTGTQAHWTVSQDHPQANRSALVPADLVKIPGPAGPIEALIYGGPGWRSCQHLILALHGGPLSAWRFEFDPLLQCLAQAGTAVVAPNYRGSTGYGDEHLRAVVDNWGGPDLEDVLHLGQSLDSERELHQLPKPVVLGASYGAFLALLAVCHKPKLWSACVALAPFLSGRSLHSCAGPAARNRIERLGGLKLINDTIGPRDVLRACSSLSVPLLVIHGKDDQVIPVEQSRLLRERLSELGRVEGVDFEYMEVGSNHEEVVMASPTVLRQKISSFCLARPG